MAICTRGTLIEALPSESLQVIVLVVKDFNYDSRHL